MSTPPPFLAVDALTVRVAPNSKSGKVILDGITLAVDQGSALGIAGESGSGKSTLLLAMMGVLREGLMQTSGDLHLQGEKILGLGDDALCTARRGTLAFIAQNTSTALTPNHKISTQMDEALRLNTPLPKPQRNDRATDLLNQVMLPDAVAILAKYPHELSGGQAQRVAIAMALASNPKCLMMDEPTTGLDVTTQATILDLLIHLQKTMGLGLICVSHDLGVLAKLCSQIGVMQAGKLVELGPKAQLLGHPKHDYTKTLLAAVPRLSTPIPPPKAARGPEVLRVSNLSLSYKSAQKRGWPWQKAKPHFALKNAGFMLHQAEVLAIVGESGSGKSTLLRAIAGMADWQQGSISYMGPKGQSIALGPLKSRRLSDLAAVQMIFQNPQSSLNPKQSVLQILAQPLRLYFPQTLSDLAARAAALCASVRLDTSYLPRFPPQLSGGERQRIAIARALCAKPKILLCDEVTTALDVSVQATVLALLRDVTVQEQSAILFVSHDLAVVRMIADRIIVMKNGEIVEMGSVAEICETPKHAYTKNLLAAVLDTNM